MKNLLKAKGIWILILSLITTICISLQVVNRFVLFSRK